jgi:ADP-ribose pyrophosphatase YjhB (NUDIX family)
LITNRQFSRFARAAPELEGNSVYTTQIPEGGLCLSSFLVLTEGDSQRVLMGRLNPDARWDEIGALDADRVRVHSKGWMLPSSHLMLYESPQEAAQRVLREQLGIQRLELSEAKVVSEVGTPKRFATLARHWDLEFIFRGEMTDGSAPRHDAWSELRFIDLKRTRRQEIARSHDEVLESAGFSFSV